MTTPNNDPSTEQVTVPYIVVAGVQLDGSDDETLRQAALLAGTTGGILHVCHSAGKPLEIAAGDAELLERTEAAMQRWAAERITDQAMAARTVLHAGLGKPAEVLIQLAADLEADVIVVGRAEERGKLSKLVIKPTARQLVEEASCPVWIAGTKDYEGVEKSPDVEAPPAPNQAERQLGKPHVYRFRRTVRLVPNQPSIDPSGLHTEDSPAM